MHLELFFVSLFVTWGLTWIIILIAERIKLVDRANERSLHMGTKPRGGGAALAISLLTLQIVWVLKGEGAELEILLWWSLAIIIAIVGLLDDFSDLPVLTRLIVQCMAAVIFCLLSFDLPLSSSPIGLLIAWLFVVWGINAANFMDGADGLLTSQAVLISLVLVFDSSSIIAEPVKMTAIVLAGGCLGFMYWNWQPSKIFLGDSGSYFIGFLIVTLVFLTSKTTASLYAGLILLIPLLGDATLTLLKRLRAGQPIMDPHRSHLYQRMILAGRSHAQTAAIYGSITGFIFAPLSISARANPSVAGEIFFGGCIFAIIVWLLAYGHFDRKAVIRT